MKDNVNHPSHYTSGKIECIDALTEATKHLTGADAFCTANAIKYLWRWKLKNGVEDLKKAKWYIDRLIKENEQGAELHQEKDKAHDTNGAIPVRGKVHIQAAADGEH